MVSEDENPVRQKRLGVLGPQESHEFMVPVKIINQGRDVPRFLVSKGYTDIMTFVMNLNRSMCPRKMENKNSIQTWPLGSPDVAISEPISKLRDMLQRIDSIIDDVPPDTGPRRFGNISFRKWHELLEERAMGLLEEFLSGELLNRGGGGGVFAKDEMVSYLLGGFGSSQRLDYGTGHELSFVAFLGCMWKLGGFRVDGVGDEEQERSIVLNVFEPYLKVVRRLILTYTLEPAGSHGVWGLDDHSFMPYIFGSAQYCPAISEDEAMPVEGSLPDAPSPGFVAQKDIVEKYRSTSIYFSAVGFINDVKTGPFWEHSPILFDISGVQKGWGKINKGMIKMFDAEVLGKFPVVQHFPFGSLFSWDPDPNAVPVPATTHTSNQPSSHTISVTGNDVGAPTARPVQETTRAPWAKSAAPGFDPMQQMRAPWAGSSSSNSQVPAATQAPWASRSIPVHPQAPTQAPWASKPTSKPTPGTHDSNKKESKIP